MELNQKRKLYIKTAKTVREYFAKEITIINDHGILFNDGFLLEFAVCGNCFPIKHPYGRKYIGARFSGAFWQFFDEKSSIVILCENMDESVKMLSCIGFTNSYDLS